MASYLSVGSLISLPTSMVVTAVAFSHKWLGGLVALHENTDMVLPAA